MAPTPVSILIPSYNYATYLPTAIESALKQDYHGEIQVLVVDDGSTDSTPEVVIAYGTRVDYHRKSNGGLSAARNTAMELAEHDLVLFLDADDALEADAVRELAQARQAFPDPPVVFGAMGKTMDADGNTVPGPLAIEREGEVDLFKVEDFLLRNRFAPIVLADRRKLLAAGGFDVTLAASEDRDMWIRAFHQGGVAMLRRPLYLKRDHGANMSKNAVRQTQSILQVLSKAKRKLGTSVCPRIWKEAEAICLYQSARMHRAAGDQTTALLQVMHSLRTCFKVRSAEAAGFPSCFRSKFVLLELAALIGLRDRGVPRRQQ